MITAERGELIINYCLAVLRAWDEEGWTGRRRITLSRFDVDCVCAYQGMFREFFEPGMTLFGCEIEVTPEIPIDVRLAEARRLRMLSSTAFNNCLSHGGILDTRSAR